MTNGTTVAPLLRLESISKHFGGVTALDNVSFELRRGEVHALLGENGAGKSTLIKVLGGIHLADSGTLHIDGRPVCIRKVADAQAYGIRIIHQELCLAPNLSVAANIYLGREPERRGWVDHGAMAANARALVARLGLDEISDVTAPVSSLSIAQRQLVEIARALSEDVRILVLDEPTSSLSEEETEALFATLRRLRGAGVGIIYISHRMAEIRRLADRITVLRDGKSIGTQAATAVDTQELVRWMVGREVSEHFPRPERGPGEVALRVENLHSEFVHGVSFELRYGEVLGIAGLVGSGRSELARALFGIDRLKSGAVYADGRRVRIRNPRDALAAGIVLVPEDRQGTGLVMMQSVAFNIALPWVEEWNPWGFPNAEKRRGIVDRAVDLFGIKVANVEHPVSDLSGGNQQKVLVSRWMEHRPKVLILDEPTRGVDVGAREEMFRVMGELVREGMAVLLISSDLVEVSSMSHRIAVYRDGQVLDVVEAEGTSLEHVMELLTGVDAV